MKYFNSNSLNELNMRTLIGWDLDDITWTQENKVHSGTKKVREILVIFLVSKKKF